MLNRAILDSATGELRGQPPSESGPATPQFAPPPKPSSSTTATSSSYVPSGTNDSATSRQADMVRADAYFDRIRYGDTYAKLR
ncbi:hypothetical protein GCM10010211_55540 [Streptomyces albospinus]|uniref:Uncharacterized protein n=1 Tax=Streptomyces albospinus TaxID=285515 RepID=A0ABQ2VHS1_9ACTN|nr:hypothetical protein GCM10010211_55540 [Streptomyces albospinus]